MELKRASGILAHPTSFPSPYGIGDLGRGAYDFIDFLREGKQTLWQILPLNPTSFGDSPYQSGSTFAMNELLICPLSPPIDKLFDENDIHTPMGWDSGERARAVEFGEVIKYKRSLYRKAFHNYKNIPDNVKFAKQLTAFFKKNKGWLDDFALFVAIKEHFIKERGEELGSKEYLAYKKKNLKLLGDENRVLDYYHGAVWNSWPEGLAQREKGALAEYSKKLAEEIEYVKFLQYIVFAQWAALKSYANENGIDVIGDLPIFVAYDSADCWVNRDLFQMKGLDPAAVAGVPPDYFSETGQLWGNPLYDWEAHKADDFAWWIGRLRHTLELVDMVRVDHFRGFEAYWSIPYGAKNAVKGKWVKAPGVLFFDAVSKQLGGARIIAEDLGVITDEVTALRKRYNYPGMKILQFGMEGGAENADLPHCYEDGHTVAYTGTHDNDTTLGWYAAATDKHRDYFRRYMNVSGENAPWDLIRLLFSSSAKWAVAPVQDVMGLGSADRMNLPGVASGNWRFRYTADMLTDEAAGALRYLSELFGRNAGAIEAEE
ncbi:MAG: 4-alpha-glucanotransferase [Defluviitaleaceae bacterium]|nr:4-alpha-glucanotransferase [Defluviitaleaceae bacterium]MCL2837360.1 4-alpha-glucanotransferase [Defluviitaleaceae bacterium]